MKSISALFRRDGEQLLQSLLQSLQHIGKDPQAVHQAFRYIHSIRSQAAYLKIPALADPAAEIEDELDALRTGEQSATPEYVRSLQNRVVELQERFRKLQESSFGMTSVVNGVGRTVEEKEPVSGDRSVDIDVLLAQVSGEETARFIDEGTQRSEHWFFISVRLNEQPEFRAQRRYLLLHTLEKTTSVLVHGGENDQDDVFCAIVGSSLPDSRIESMLTTSGVAHVHLQELSTGFMKARLQPAARYQPALLSGTEDVSLQLSLREYERLQLGLAKIGGLAGDGGARISGELTRLISHSGAVPIVDVFASLEPVARREAANQGKKLRYKIIHSDVRIPPAVAGVLGESLLHLVRNSVDHGIELPAERSAAGKSEIGEIVVSAVQDNNSIHIIIGDDGRGIHVTGKADEALQLITRPGFTTAAESNARSLSGRGVGLDIVRHSVENLLRGSLQLNSEDGAVFDLCIPSSAELLSVVIVLSPSVQTEQGAYIAVPGMCIYDRFSLHASRLSRSSTGRTYYVYNGRSLPAYSVSGGDIPEDADCSEGLLVRTMGKEKIFCCKEAVAEEAVVLHPLEIFSEVLQCNVQLWDPWS
ncbi:MAG: ATP-binding protein [Spirochaeta sp.]